jgi:hypothetical protein
MKRGLIQLGMTAALLCLLPSARAANLAIGSTAPEIEGKDFWGHW